MMRWLLAQVTRPIQRWHWAASEDARRRAEWEGVAYHIEALHRWYFENDGSHFILAMAYAHLWRNEEAIAEFLKIREPLPGDEAEDDRYLNLALCFARLGNWSRAAEVLRGYEPRTSSSATDEHYRKLLANIEFNEGFERAAWPRVQQARAAEDWNLVIHLLDPLHRRGFGTCTTLVLEADAYASMGEWQRCIESLDKIGEVSPHSEPDVHARYIWLRALALSRLGHTVEYSDLVSQSALPECPPDIRQQLEALGVFPPPPGA